MKSLVVTWYVCIVPLQIDTFGVQRGGLETQIRREVCEDP